MAIQFVPPAEDIPVHSAQDPMATESVELAVVSVPNPMATQWVPPLVVGVAPSPPMATL